MATKDLYCKAGKRRCALLDKTGNGRLWCNSNEDPSSWELCPFPKFRDKKLKRKILEEKEYARRNCKTTI